MRLENYTNQELLMQIRNFDFEIEKLQNTKDLFEKQITINNRKIKNASTGVNKQAKKI
jgi:hypothetical protein